MERSPISVKTALSWQLLVGLAIAVAFAPMAGCGGCQKSQTGKEKQDKEKKKEEKEKKKPPISAKRLRVSPSDDLFTLNAVTCRTACARPVGNDQCDALV